MRILILFFCVIHTVSCFLVAQLTDLHVGEGCGPGWYNGTDHCYSVHALAAAVDKVNEDLVPRGVKHVFVTGDISSSAQPQQFSKARDILSRLEVPWWPVMGNHDVWTYTSDYNSPKPTGDTVFAKTFVNRLQNNPELLYHNVTAFDKNNDCVVQNQNFELVLNLDGSVFPPNTTDLSDTSTIKLVVLGLDFNTREAALPGYKGALPQAELMDFTDGSFPWLRERLSAHRPYSPLFYFLIHQPFRCPWYLPTWSFCWTTPDKAAFRNLVSQYYPNVGKNLWGQLAGHVHIWYNSTAFDEWPTFRLWESSATKGGAFDEHMKSAIGLFDIDETSGRVSDIHKIWYENGKWHEQSD